MRGVRYILGVLLAVQLAACSPLFVLRAGYEEAKILSRRQSIARLLEDPAVPEERRSKLELVVQARDFAADSLDLDAGDSYTTFSQLDSDTLALVLSAARKDAFEPHTWWFPIVGRVPYKAYFSESSARNAVESLEARGYDAYVRPTSAFSTLGWFNDPMVSPLLRYDSVSLVNTVVHEIFHNTLYLSGQATFNESLAQFVGARGAIAFFCSARVDPALCRTAEAAWQDELRFGAFLTELVDELEALYSREDLESEEKIRRREGIFARATERFENQIRPSLRVRGFGSFTQAPLNNASLIARRIYYRDLDLFEEVYRASGEELLVAVQRILEAARAEPEMPFEAVGSLVRGGTGEF
ncbi:MAG: aminopeptidase [Gemmatimonadota bacterium]